jgi:hypothetical protein
MKTSTNNTKTLFFRCRPELRKAIEERTEKEGYPSMSAFINVCLTKEVFGNGCSCANKEEN